MLIAELGTSWVGVVEVVVAGTVCYLLVIALTRVAGVRSMAKMSAFDFAATVAVGSTVSSVLLGSAPLAAGVVGLCLLFALQFLVASLRRRGVLSGLVDNRPLLLMAHGKVLPAHLRHARLTQNELWSQLRRAGIASPDCVQAVVFEPTGDLSVIRTGEPLDLAVFDGVRGLEELRDPTRGDSPPPR